MEAQASMLPGLKLFNPLITTDEATDALIPHPEAGQLEIEGHLCSMCMLPICPG